LKNLAYKKAPTTGKHPKSTTDPKVVILNQPISQSSHSANICAKTDRPLTKMTVSHGVLTQEDSRNYTFKSIEFCEAFLKK
jgi:hypothetical protein